MNDPLTPKQMRALHAAENLAIRRVRAFSVPNLPSVPPAALPSLPSKPAAPPRAGNIAYASNVGYFFKAKTLSSATPVKKGQVLGVIRALGIEFPVHAPCTGWIDGIHESCGSAVEYGQPLVVLREQTRPSEP